MGFVKTHWSAARDCNNSPPCHGWEVEYCSCGGLRISGSSGTVLNNAFSWTMYVKDMHVLLYDWRHRLHQLCRRLQEATVKAVYTGATRPRMGYASQVWSGRPMESLQRLL